MNTDDFVQVIRDTIHALFDGSFPTLGMTEKALKNIHTPTMVMLGNDDIHPRRVAELVHRLIPNCQWAEIRPHSEDPEGYSERVLAGLETNVHQQAQE